MKVFLKGYMQGWALISRVAMLGGALAMIRPPHLREVLQNLSECNSLQLNRSWTTLTVSQFKQQKLKLNLFERCSIRIQISA